jgi:hypothetical protein
VAHHYLEQVVHVGHGCVLHHSAEWPQNVKDLLIQIAVDKPRALKEPPGVHNLAILRSHMRSSQPELCITPVSRGIRTYLWPMACQLPTPI